MRHVRLVAGRELMDAFRSKAYWIMMGVLVAAAIAVLVLPRVLDGGTTYDLGMVGDDAGVEQDVRALAESFGAELEVERFDDVGAARRAVTEDEVDVALVLEDGDRQLVRRSDSSETLVSLAGQAAATAEVRRQLGEAGLDADRVDAVLATPPPREVVVDDDQPERSAVAYGLSLALYLALFTGGMGVATGVAVEKSSRIAEVLVTMVRPSRLLAGKVLGVGASTLLLLLALAVPFGVGIAVGAVDLPSAAAVDVVAAVGWFVLGYGIYATIFAALGALVDRQEDLGSVVAPVSAALIASYLLAIQAQAQPEGTLAAVTSYFPLSAPMVMPVRIAEGAVGPAEVALSVAIAVATFAVMVWLGAGVYRRALLRGGRRLKLTEVLRS